MNVNQNIDNSDTNDLKFAPLYLDEAFTLDSSIMNEVKRLEELDKGSSTSQIEDINLNFKPTLDNRMLSLESLPFIPYPSKVENLDLNPSNFNKFIPFYENDKNNLNEYDDFFDDNLKYPNEVDDSALYSYNKPMLNPGVKLPVVNPIDILRNLDTENIEISDSLNRGFEKSNEIQNIFKKIEANDTIVLATMKAYRIPYPIAKLLIKKIIKATLEYER